MRIWVLSVSESRQNICPAKYGSIRQPYCFRELPPCPILKETLEIHFHMPLLTFCSQDCLNWAILPRADGALMMRAGLLHGRFSGDPSFAYEHTVTLRVGEGDSAHEETTTIEMKEEDRLAAVIGTIDDEVAVVPQGAYMKTPTGVVQQNDAFKGM